jgi:hypothetical protein
MSQNIPVSNRKSQIIDVFSLMYQSLEWKKLVIKAWDIASSQSTAHMQQGIIGFIDQLHI